MLVSTAVCRFSDEGEPLGKIRLLFSTLVVLCVAVTATAQADYSSVNAFVKSVVKGTDRLSVKAKGDLNGDGLEDWAGVVRRQQPDTSPTYQLYVLLRLPKGGYHLAEKSIEEEIPGMGCCWLESLEIRRASIFIQNNAKTVSVMEAVTHQFKLVKDEWRLVGIKSFYTDHTPDAPETLDTDMNLLTGSVIEKSQKGNKKPVTKSRIMKFAPFLLKDFDFSIRFGNEESQ